jgi:hypothetical protein
VTCSRHLGGFFMLNPPIREEEGPEIKTGAEFSASTTKGFRGRKQPS